MTLKTSVMYLPRPATTYPGCYPLHFERRIPGILGTDNYIHLFSGMSITGIKCDINPGVFPDIVADAHNLPFPDNYFEGAIADPPYTPEFAKDLYNCDYPRWSEWTKEMIRVIRPGSYVAVMQNYIVPRLPDCDYEEIITILLRIKQYPKILTVQRKRT